MLAVRRQLSAEKVAAENASRLLEDAMLQRISRRHIGRLAADIELLDKRMVEIVASDAALAHRYRLLTSMPGVGDVRTFRQVLYMAAMSASNWNPALKLFHDRPQRIDRVSTTDDWAHQAIISG
jgi:transposase